MNLPELAHDDPDAAERTLEQCLRHWSGPRFYVQHFSALYDRIQTDLYRGEPESAWRRIHQQRSTIVRSLLLRVQVSRVFTYQTRARCALASAAKGADPETMLRLANRDARRVEREGQPWTQPLAELIRAAVAACRGRRDAAARLLEQAVGHFEQVDMVLYAAAARRRLGELIGGETGRELIRRADAWMKNQGVRNPARMTAMCAPGFPGSKP